MTAEQLIKKINNKESKIMVVGMGYVGLPLALAFASAGFRTFGIDNNPKRVKNLNEGINHIIPGDTSLKKVIDEGKFSASSDFSLAQKCDCICICVPTPLTKNREPDLSHIRNALVSLKRNLSKGKLIVLESTTYPGTTEEVLKPVIESTGLEVGRDIFLAFSPERIDPGNTVYKTTNTPRVVGGITKQCTSIAMTLYSFITNKVVQASSARTAEMVKLYENIFRAINIALVNELSLLCRRMDISIWEVIELAKSKPYGFMPFYPGPGLGGHCIPIDPFYLSWKAREYDFNTKFIELAGEINTRMPYEVVDLINQALSEAGKCINGSRILILGAAYKKDVADIRSSPSLKIIEILKKKKADVYYNDPLVEHIDLSFGKLYSVPLKNLSWYDCVVIATDHSVYDIEKIVNDSNLIVDTRNATGNVLENRERVYRI